MAEELETKLIELVSADRIEIPISSMSGKLKRMKKKMAEGIDLSSCKGRYQGDRVYARVEEEDTMKARGMSEGIDRFCEQYPKYGQILRGLVEEQRSVREVSLYFGMNEGCKISANDYVGIMTGMGFTDAGARALYPELVNVSRTISRKRDEERSILIG